MRRLIIAFMLAIIAFSVVPIVQAPSEQVVNGGFETGNLTGWQIKELTANNPRYGAMEEAAHSGSFGFCFDTQGNGGYICLKQVFPVPILASSVRSFGFWARNKEMGSPMDVGLTWYATNGSYDTAYAWLDWDDTSWHYVNVTEVMDIYGWRESDIQIAYIEVFASGVQAAYIDDISLVGDPASQTPNGGEGEDDGQTTPPNWPLRPGTQPQPRPGESAEEDWTSRIVEAAKELIMRLLGNPTILLLLLIFAAIMAYYTLRRH